MRVGLLITSIGNFGQKGFYNAQEIGLAKVLDRLVDEVIIYKSVPKNQQRIREKIEGCRYAVLHLIPTRSIGINGWMNLSVLDTSLDALIYFSDTQLMVPTVARWAEKHGVKLYPYIGVLESHSTNPAKKFLIDHLFKRNLEIYRKVHCFVKTPDVETRLKAYNVAEITVTPVGLDETLLRDNYMQVEPNEIKKKYGYQPHERVLLFIGRFVAEKQPERMIDIFKGVYAQNEDYRLLMVGTGELRKITEERAKEYCLSEKVRFIDKIPNSDIWELYRMSDAFVNLNQQEIFGMAILEAMYYGCKVVAWNAPGPDSIIESSYDGILCASNEDVIDAILNKAIVEDVAHAKICNCYLWNNTADKMVAEMKKMGVETNE